MRAETVPGGIVTQLGHSLRGNGEQVLGLAFQQIGDGRDLVWAAVVQDSLGGTCTIGFEQRQGIGGDGRVPVLGQDVEDGVGKDRWLHLIAG